MDAPEDLRALSAQLQPSLQAALAVPPPLPPEAQRVATKGAKNLALTRSQSVYDLATGVRILGVYARRDQAITCARLLRAVPFTGNYTLYEPIVMLFCLAVRLASSTPEQASVEAEFEPSILHPYGSTRGDVLSRDTVQRRLQGRAIRQFRLREPQPSKVSIKVYNTLLDLLELDFMWALGGSPSWPRPRIEEEIVLNEDYLRALPKMSPG